VKARCWDLAAERSTSYFTILARPRGICGPARTGKLRHRSRKRGSRNRGKGRQRAARAQRWIERRQSVTSRRLDGRINLLQGRPRLGLACLPQLFLGVNPLGCRVGRRLGHGLFLTRATRERHAGNSNEETIFDFHYPLFGTAEPFGCSPAASREASEREIELRRLAVNIFLESRERIRDLFRAVIFPPSIASRWNNFAISHTRRCANLPPGHQQSNRHQHLCCNIVMRLSSRID
jgi:hypothetical protein